jgi:hypothetical protein
LAAPLRHFHSHQSSWALTRSTARVTRISPSQRRRPRQGLRP